MRRTLLAVLFCLVVSNAWAAFQPGPFPWPPNSVVLPEQVSAESVSNFALTSRYGALISITVKIGATSGYLMVFDAAALPSNGAVTPSYCFPVASNGTNGALAVNWTWPAGFTNGIIAAFSTGANCDTLTASATAKFMAQAF